VGRGSGTFQGSFHLEEDAVTVAYQEDVSDGLAMFKAGAGQFAQGDGTSLESEVDGEIQFAPGGGEFSRVISCGGVQRSVPMEHSRNPALRGQIEQILKARPDDHFGTVVKAVCQTP
jgi:hypothetical protein